MVKDCPVCGREFIVSWPGGWSYRKGGEYLCSWKCLQQKRKGSRKMGDAEENRTQSGEARENVGLVWDESVAEEYRREQAQKATGERDLWKTAAVRNSTMGTFYYDEKYRTVDWRSPYGEEISLPPEDWKWLADHIGMILHALGVDE